MSAKRRGRIWAIAVIVLVGTAALVWPQIRAHLQAVAVFDQVGSQPVPWAVRAMVAHPITSREISIPSSAGPVRARIYESIGREPVGRPKAKGLVVFHGVHHLGMDEPRLKAFAEAMASCGLRVLTPELPAIKDYHVGPESVRVIGESARWFATQTGEPVGVMGLSFSGGLALLAAGNDEYAPSMKFVFAVGSQDSMGRVAKFFMTGKDPRPDENVEVLKPHEYGALVLEYEHVEDFVPAEDVGAVAEVLRWHLYEDVAGEKAAIAKLNDAQRVEATDLMNSTLPKTVAQLEQNAMKRAGEMAAVSPAGHLQRLQVPVYLLHGEADNIIPSAETMWMATEVPKSELKEWLVSPVISHIDMNKQVTLADQWRLVHFMARVMLAAGAR